MGCINTKQKIIIKSIDVSEVKSQKSKNSKNSKNSQKIQNIQKDKLSDSDRQIKFNDIKEPKYQYISSCEISEISEISKEDSVVENWINIEKFY